MTCAKAKRAAARTADDEDAAAAERVAELADDGAEHERQHARARLEPARDEGDRGERLFAAGAVRLVARDAGLALVEVR